MRNFEELFPKDKISNWKADDDTCSCELKAMGKIGLKRVASTPYKLIYLDSHDKTPIKFHLNIFIEGTDSTCEVHLEFDGEVNPFMKMMIEKPLTEFFNGLVTKLARKYM